MFISGDTALDLFLFVISVAYLFQRSVAKAGEAPAPPPPVADALYAPTPVPSGPAGGSEGSGDPVAPPTLESAWGMLLHAPEALPKGILPFLRAAEADFPREGLIRLSLTPGPGLDRLQDTLTQRALREALSTRARREVDVEIHTAPVGGGPPARITEETVRDGRLQELVDKEPTLGEAVKELDLELLD